MAAYTTIAIKLSCTTPPWDMIHCIHLGKRVAHTPWIARHQRQLRPQLECM